MAIKKINTLFLIIFCFMACNKHFSDIGESPGRFEGSALQKKELIVAESFFVDVQLPASKAIMLVVSDNYGVCDAATAGSLQLPGNIYTAVLFDTKIPKTQSPGKGLYSLLWNLSLVELATSSDAYAVEGKLGYARLVEQGLDDTLRQSSVSGAIEFIQDPQYYSKGTLSFTVYTVFENKNNVLSGSVLNARYCEGLRRLFEDPVPVCIAQ